MNKNLYQLTTKNVNIRLFAFEEEKNVKEYWATFTLTNTLLNFREQVNALNESEVELKNTISLSGNLQKAMPIFRQYFLSDAANQQAQLYTLIEKHKGVVCAIQQPPANGAKVALLVYYATGTQNKYIGDTLSVAHHGYEELWTAQLYQNTGSAYMQAHYILSHYAAWLKQQECTLAANCLRTWIYVNDIDNQYGAIVKARNDVFDAENLTPQNHYIASTGIGGRIAYHSAYCIVNAYAIKGVKPKQVNYLYAKQCLNRTTDYGVRFERGVCIDFAGRRKVFISGTASIDRQGNVLHTGDVQKQLLRIWYNIEALLSEAQCNFNNVTMLIVYLRDMADRQIVEQMMECKFRHTPYIIVMAAVCRPQWLIEIECMAIKKI